MASDDEELDEIDEELARIEREIQELEDEAGQPPEPDAPDPEADADVPEPGEVFEGEAEVEETEGLFSRIVNRFRSEEDAEETDGQDEAPEATEEDDEDLDVATGRAEDEPPDADLEEATEAPQPTEDAEDDEDLEGAGQAAGDEQEAVSPFPEPSDEPEEFEEPQRSAPLEQAPPAPSDAEAAEAGPAPALPPREEPATVAPEDDAEEAAASDEEGDDEASSLWGKLTDRLPGSLVHGSTAVSESVADPGGGISRHRRPPAGAGHAYEAVESSGGVALFDRFRGSQADEEEDEDRRGIIVGLLIAVLLLALLAAGVYYVLGPGAGGGGDLSADLVADSFTTEDGSYVAKRGEAITLDAGASSGEPEEFRWDFGDGTEQTTSEPTVQHTYDERGSYAVELVVVAGRSQQSTEIQIAVVDPPDPQPQILLDGEPVAEPATVGNNVFVGDTVTLDGTASSADADYAISSYSWDIDGDAEPDATGPTAELGFEERGAWNVSLTVGDELGNEASQSQRVHVSDRIVIEDTVGPSTDEADSNDHEVSIEEARQGAVPVELQLQLSYEASANDTGGLPVQPVVEPNLDLEVSDPENNTYEAEDDEGGGNETLILSRGELTALGMWNITVTQDNTNAGTASEVEYELVVETVY